MAKKRATRAEAEIDGAVLEDDPGVDLAALVGEPTAIVGAEDEAIPPAGPAELTPADPGWSDHVLSLLTPDEVDPQGNPKVDGLRRLVVKLLGPILESTAHTVQAPSHQNGFHSTVEYQVEVAFGPPATYGTPTDIRVFRDVADVYPGNTDAKYAIHGTATAATKAEARAYRKALQLRKVSADEVAGLPPLTESGFSGLITDGQVHALNKLCRDLDVDVVALVNSGSKKYPSIRSIPYEKAGAILEHLNKFLQAPAKIPADLKGYVNHWQTTPGDAA